MWVTFRYLVQALLLPRTWDHLCYVAQVGDERITGVSAAQSDRTGQGGQREKREDIQHTGTEDSTWKRRETKKTNEKMPEKGTSHTTFLPKTINRIGPLNYN